MREGSILTLDPIFWVKLESGQVTIQHMGTNSMLAEVRWPFGVSEDFDRAQRTEGCLEDAFYAFVNKLFFSASRYRAILRVTITCILFRSIDTYLLFLNVLLFNALLRIGYGSSSLDPGSTRTPSICHDLVHGLFTESANVKDVPRLTDENI